VSHAKKHHVQFIANMVASSNSRRVVALFVDVECANVSDVNHATGVIYLNITNTDARSDASANHASQLNVQNVVHGDTRGNTNTVVLDGVNVNHVVRYHVQNVVILA